MKQIHILFFEGCPNHEPAMSLARDVVAELGVDAEVFEIEVLRPGDAEALKFLGSPSIRVDGVDIEVGARDRRDFGFACRTYGGEGLPPREMLVAALENDPGSFSSGIADADERRDAGGGASGSPSAERRGLWAAGGGLAAAIVGSACCWLPLVLIASGASAGSIGLLFASTRPIFLSLAALLLAVGFYYTYLRKQECEPGSACETERPAAGRFNQPMLWIASVGVVVFALFPSYVGIFYPDTVDAAGIADVDEFATVTVRIEGMSCEGCTVNVQNEIAKVAGVLGVEVEYEEKIAVVEFDPAAAPSIASILMAVERAGYEASLKEGP